MSLGRPRIQPSAAVSAALRSAQELVATPAEVAACGLRLETPADPVASVVIPTYGKLAYTLTCLTSLSRLPDRTPFEIIVIDDRSPDRSGAVIESIPGVRLLRNEENLGFVRSCNRGVRAARGRFVALLNNDTFVLPGWLDSLVEVARQPGTGLVGSKLIFGDGSLQEAGGTVWSDGNAVNHGRHGDPSAPEFNYLKEVDYCSGASILLERQFFEQLGGFDERFAPAYWEDTDLAFKTRAAGRRVLYQPRSAVIHFEGISYGTDTGSGIKAYQALNRRKFAEKWRAALGDQAPDRSLAFQARDRSYRRPAILFMDHCVPEVDRSAGARSTFQYMTLLARAGFNVKLWPACTIYDAAYARLCEDAGIEVLAPTRTVKRFLRRLRFARWIRKHGQHFQYVFFNRPELTAAYLPIVRRHSRAKCLFYGHDLHAQRLQREAEVTRQRGLVRKAARYARLESTVWRSADAVYYPSATECAHVLSRTPGRPVRRIPVYLYDRIRADSPGFAGRRGLLFVGGFAHRPNVDAVLWFMAEIWPGVLRSDPDITLVIAGANPPPAVLQCRSPAVQVTGFVDDAALRSLYDRSRLAIAPLRYGAGIKGKIIEAMAHGLPLVTTPVGAEGIDGEALAVIAQPAPFAAEITRLYSSAGEWMERRRRGFEVVAEHFSENAARRILAQDIPELANPGRPAP